VFPVGIGLRDPRSQKRDLGHPSIVSEMRVGSGGLGKTADLSTPLRISCHAAVGHGHVCGFR
jgi:hypothetical protein